MRKYSDISMRPAQVPGLNFSELIMLRLKIYVLKSFLVSLVVCLWLPTPARAYIDLAPTLAKIISDSNKIALVEVVKFDREKHVVDLKEVRVLKGQASAELARHELASAEKGVVPRQILQWAAPGARGVLFGSRNITLVCIGPGWYQVRSTGTGTWRLGADRPDLPLAYYGSLSRLADGIEVMLAGKTAVLTVVAFGADNEGASFDLALNRQNLPGLARLQRIRANLQMPGMVAGASSNPAYFLGAGAVDEDDIPGLIEKLKSSDAMVRAEAAEDLRCLGRKARDAAAPLTKLLGDPAERVRLAAASALLQIAPKDAKPVDVLSRGLDSRDSSVRCEAAGAAGQAGAAAAPLAEKLAGLLKDKDESVRITALQAISVLGPDAAKAAGAVVPLLEDRELMVDAADAMGRIGSAARPALKTLAKMLTSEQADVRWAAVRAMAQIGGDDAHPAVDFMVRALRNATEVEGYNMMIYFSLLGPVARDAIPSIQNAPIKNPVLPSATIWAIQSDNTLPWQSGRGGRGGGPGGGPGGPGGPGGGGRGRGGPGGGGDIFLFVYEAYVHELGERLRPTARLLAQKIMDGTAGEVPDYGYKILACGPEEAIAVLAPYLADKDIALRERAVVALGTMGPSAAPAKDRVETAMNKAATDGEKRLLKWCLREITSEQ
jgi:HEAT repeat protein